MAAAGFISLGAVDGRHLARALEAHRRWCRTNGVAFPAALTALELALSASTGQDRTEATDDDGFGDAAGMTPLALTFAECADALRVSERSVRRMVATGELHAISVGGRRRVHHPDLTEYADNLRTETRTT